MLLNIHVFSDVTLTVVYVGASDLNELLHLGLLDSTDEGTMLL
jgi:hypothetical protein